MPITQTRRRALATLAAGGAASLIRVPNSFATEERLETTAIRLGKIANMCVAPQYVAEELLRAEGFTDVRYLAMPPGGTSPALGHGEIDISLEYAPLLAIALDAGEPITVVAGVMVGCIELFANKPVQGVAGLKGRKVGVPGLGGSAHVLVSLMAANVGLKPAEHINWVTAESAERLVELFANGEVDAYLGQPPVSQDLRARHIGQVIVNSAVDRPWSQYFCCMLGGNRDYIRKYPVAAKRAVRAILKATDLCATEPDRAARRIVEGGFTPRYDYARQTLSENLYDKWREYDAEDTLRFFALRLHETGFIKSNPQKIIADGTDWRFLNELKRELKA
jgi:NitT/TauT family transport system substrate-binding protein